MLAASTQPGNKFQPNTIFSSGQGEAAVVMPMSMPLPMAPPVAMPMPGMPMGGYGDMSMMMGQQMGMMMPPPPPPPMGYPSYGQDPQAAYGMPQGYGGMMGTMPPPPPPPMMMPGYGMPPPPPPQQQQYYQQQQ